MCTYKIRHQFVLVERLQVTVGLCDKQSCHFSIFFWCTLHYVRHDVIIRKQTDIKCFIIKFHCGVLPCWLINLILCWTSAPDSSHSCGIVLRFFVKDCYYSQVFFAGIARNQIGSSLNTAWNAYFILPIWMKKALGHLETNFLLKCISSFGQMCYQLSLHID